MLVKILFLALVALQIADVATTHYAIKHRIGEEANGIMRGLMDLFGVLPALIGTKVIFLSLAWYTLRFDNAAWAIGALCALYAWVGWNNFRVIKATA